MKDRLLFNNDRNNFLETNLKKKYDRITFNIKCNVITISISWKNNKNLLFMYLFGPDKNLYGQIVTNSKDGTRCISTISDYTSPCCKTLKSSETFQGEWTIEYAIYGEVESNTASILVKEEDEFNHKLKEISLIERPKISEHTIYDEMKWYAGDFHTHTIFSDGKMTREENNDIAKKQDLDFFIPTDHNIFHYKWPKSDDVFIYPGVEITSSYGHINLLFSEKNPFEEHSIFEIENKTSLIEIIKEAEKYSIVSINHPFMPPWDFLLGDLPLEYVKILEIINDPTYKTSINATNDAKDKWNCLLNDGFKVVGIGGSDSHLRPNEKYANSEYPSILGDPKTYLYSKSNSWNDLKQALIQGDVVVSRKDFIDLNIHGLNRENNSFEGKVLLESKLTNETFHDLDLYHNWIIDGKTILKEKGLVSKLNQEIDLKYHWIRLDITDEDDNLYGFTNPIFFNRDEKTQSMKYWKDLMVKKYEN